MKNILNNIEKTPSAQDRLCKGRHLHDMVLWEHPNTADFCYWEKNNLITEHYLHLLHDNEKVIGQRVVLPKDTILHRYSFAKIVGTGCVICDCNIHQPVFLPRNLVRQLRDIRTRRGMLWLSEGFPGGARTVSILKPLSRFGGLTLKSWREVYENRRN